MIDRYSRFDNAMVLGDFHLEPDDKDLLSLVQEHSLYNLIKHPTCFKSSYGRCIDLILTNCKHSFMHSKSFETGFSDHHHMIYTIMKTAFNKVPPKKVVFRDYKKWSQSKFERELKDNLISNHPSQSMNFEQIFRETLEANSPLKQRY